MKKLLLKNPSFIYIEKSFGEWLDILGYAETTVYNLPNLVREFLHHLEEQEVKSIKEIDVKHFKHHYETLKTRTNTRQGGGLSNSYLNKHLQALYKFTDYLRHTGKMILPHLHIEWEKDDTLEIETLTQEEIQLLYKATINQNAGTLLEPLNSRDRAILSIFYGCGLRRNEGYHLNISDINFDKQILHVRKGKNYKERFVPFNKTISNYLQEYIYDDRPQLLKGAKMEALFISQKGKRMETQSMALRLKLLQQRTEDTALQQKNVRLHVLRHSIATHFLQNGMSVEKIARFLGHSSLESTQVYTHLVNEDGNGEAILKPQLYRNIPRYEILKLHEDE